LSLVVAGTNPDIGSIQGAFLALMGSLGLAVSSLVSKRLLNRMSPLTLTAWQFFLGAIPLIVAALIIDGLPRFEPTAIAVGGLFYLGVISSAGGSIVWNRLLKHSDVTALTALTMLTPPLSLILSLLFFNDSVSLIQWIGVAVVLASISWLELRETRR
jgi:probable blue pigment (indigoidine) exporter